MRIWRNVEGKLIDAAIDPQDLVFLFEADSPPITCTLPTPPPPLADYILKDSSGWHYATDGISGLRDAATGERFAYNFADRCGSKLR